MKLLSSFALPPLLLLPATPGRAAPLFSEHDQQVEALLAQMTLDEKIGQMVQVDSKRAEGHDRRAKILPRLGSERRQF